MNCHNPEKAKSGLDLSTFSTAMKGGSGGKIAEPGDTASKIISLLQQTAEPKMPPEGEPLSSSKISIIKSWIEGGLLENKTSSARKPSKPKFNTSMSANPNARPAGEAPMPQDLLLEPPVVTSRGTVVKAIAASPWSPLIAVTSQKQILLFDTNLLELSAILPFPEGEPVSLQFTPDAHYLIVGGGIAGKSGLTATYDVITGKRILTVGKEFDSVLAADIRPGFDTVITGSPSRMIKFWNAQSGDMKRSIKKHPDWVTALDISPDGILVATGDRNGGVYVWEAESGNEFHTLRAHQGAITSLTYRADSNILASASADGTIRFWEMNGGGETNKMNAHDGGVTGFSFARDGSSLSVGRDKKIKLWKPDSGFLKELPALTILPTACAIEPEGKKAYIGCENGDILVYEISSNKLITTLNNFPPTLLTRIEKIKNDLDKKIGDATELNKQIKHWQAATINTQALAKQQEADSQQTEFFGQCDELNAAYTDLAKLYTEQTETEKRNKQLTSLLQKRSGDSLLENEILLLLSLEKNKLTQTEQALSKAEETYVNLKKSINHDTANRVVISSQAKDLLRKYKAALAEK